MHTEEDLLHKLLYREWKKITNIINKSCVGVNNDDDAVIYIFLGFPSKL